MKATEAKKSAAPKLPAAWFQNGFHRFLRRYLRRHFHAIAIQRSWHPSRQASVATLLEDPTVPILVYCNHPSWWDPLIGHFLNARLFASRQFYAPIDAEALSRYRVFEKLGFFGIAGHSSAGAADFLRTTATLLARPGSALWLTPEGRFADVRDNTAAFMPGLAHVCSRTAKGLVIPIALEYVFWEERLPECLVQCGAIASLADFPDRTKGQWDTDLRHRLRSAQSDLAALSIARDGAAFDNLLFGKQGARGCYDWMRRMKSFLTGQTFHAAHGEKLR